MSEIKYLKYEQLYTKANTEYVRFTQEDQSYIISLLVRSLSYIGEMDNSKDKEWKMINKMVLHKPLDNLPKGKHGKNTMISFMSGLINNLMFGTQRNFSTIQLDALEFITNKMNILFDDIPELRFMVDIYAKGKDYN